MLMERLGIERGQVMDDSHIKKLLREGDFSKLLSKMGWENPPQYEAVEVGDSELAPTAIAHKMHIVVAWRVDCPEGLPTRSEQHRLVRALKRLCSHQLVVFVAKHDHLWLWPEQRPSGVGYRLVDHKYNIANPTDALLQRIKQATFTISEHNSLTSSEVLNRVRCSFNADKVTKRFYTEFRKRHLHFTHSISGITEDHNRRWYASIVLNRLMFIYFIQKKLFLSNDPQYLSNRLQRVQKHFGKDKFYRQFLLPLFHEGLGNPKPHYQDATISDLIGKPPYINGGIFEPHMLETRDIGTQIQIPDDAFESLFAFFEKWRWHLDENPGGHPNEINPDILGFIFEQYINFTDKGQKEKGAYYTKPDVTGYMATNTLLPALADRFVAAGLDDPAILLRCSGDNYIYDSVVHGVDKALPERERERERSSSVDELKLSDDIALPGERWCDLTHRRERAATIRGLIASQRDWHIDDAITENLNLRELFTDYLSTLATPNECDQAFKVLKSLTICDPTVGSGAFLFAALEVLEPLYETVLERATEIQQRNPTNKSADCLNEATEGTTRKYWMLKTLCLNNLYGVDLMAEAPEIAKLRLFLKLAAQIDDPKLIEPLPDLDFNIKSGNLLVGIASKDDFQNRLGGTLEASALLADVNAVAEQMAKEYGYFVAIQARDSSIDIANSKQRLNTKLENARHACNQILYDVRSTKPNSQPFQEWIDAYQPFHWFVEFPSVWATGGFDVVIGNPPYIQKKHVKGYTWRGYKTEKCPDLYAVCMERATSLLNQNGRFSMIVMHSLCFGQNYKVLRELLQRKFKKLWVSSYAKDPCSLFSGQAKVRSSIVLARSNSNKTELQTSSCRRWLKPMRTYVFDSIEYTSPSQSLFECTIAQQWPFLDDGTISRAFDHLTTNNQPLRHGTVNHVTNYQIAFKKVAYCMLNISEHPPPTIGNAKTQRYGYFYFTCEQERDLAITMFAGRWGYLWWLKFGDMKLVFSPLDLSSNLQQAFGNPENLAWQVNAGVNVAHYNMLKVRHITDEADLLLARLWGIEYAYEAAGNWRDRMVFGNKE